MTSEGQRAGKDRPGDASGHGFGGRNDRGGTSHPEIDALIRKLAAVVSPAAAAAETAVSVERVRSHLTALDLMRDGIAADLAAQMVMAAVVAGEGGAFRDSGFNGLLCWLSDYARSRNASVNPDAVFNEFCQQHKIFVIGLFKQYFRGHDVSSGQAESCASDLWYKVVKHVTKAASGCVHTATELLFERIVTGRIPVDSPEAVKILRTIAHGVYDDWRRKNLPFTRSQNDKRKGLATSLQKAHREHAGADVVSGIATRIDAIKPHRVTVSLDAPVSDDAGMPALIGQMVDTTVDDPVKEADRRMRREALSRELLSLGETERAVLSMYFSREMTYEEIAAALGKGKTTVHRLAIGALAKLRQRLEGEE